MNNILMEMQGTAQQYVEILAEILQIDVTIIDSNQIRVAGSGRMKNRIGDMSSYGLVVKSAIDENKLTIMENPSTSDICRICPKYATCDNKSEVWLPLNLQSKVIGVLGFVCFEEQQREKFLNNYNIYLKFLKQFGELLESKANDTLRETQNSNVLLLLENILDRIESGILVLDQNLGISRINQTGRKLLFLRETLKESCPPASLTPIEKSHDGLQEYSLKIGNISYLLTGKIYDLEIGQYRQLFVFQRANLDPTSATKQNLLVKTRELDRILGTSSAITAVKERIETVASSLSNVLITGESGTGKELVATALHGESSRSNFPFLAINCASIPESLLESELFGYVRGAFTGADQKGRKGLFESAEGGTVFLDEIGDMPLFLQAKILRVLENREITRLGSNKNVKINVRIVAATNKNLEAMIEKGLFREDLYYRLNVIPISLPPLRQRKEDIPIIASGFIERYSALLNKLVRGIDDSFWKLLTTYDWPGNIRELQNTIEYVINILPYSGVLVPSLLPEKFFHPEMHPTVAVTEDLNLSHLEKDTIKRALTIYGSSQEGKKAAAEKLGIGIATLYRKIKLYRL